MTSKLGWNSEVTLNPHLHFQSPGHEKWSDAKFWNCMGSMWAMPQCLPLPSAPVYPRLWHCMSGDSGSPHKQKARAQASGMELLHLPREVSLPFMSQLKFSSHASHSVNDKRSRDNLATPNTNNTVTVRDRSSWTLIVGDGLLPPLSVYCRQFFPSFVLGRCICGNSCVRFQWFSLPASDWQMTLSFCFCLKGTHLQIMHAVQLKTRCIWGALALYALAEL